MDLLNSGCSRSRDEQFLYASHADIPINN